MKWLAMFILCIFAAIICIGAAKFPGRMDIAGIDALSKDALLQFLMEKNSNLERNYAKRVVAAYAEECRCEGIRLLVAFAQMCLETNYLKFTGQVKLEQNNFCGFGVAGPDNDGDYFSTVEGGVRTHVQHLKAYASKRALNNPCIDMRRAYIPAIGKLRTVKNLTKTWAMDDQYDQLIASIMANIRKSASFVWWGIGRFN
ncbi:MAG: glucosaminidase domain-containing protein [Puniceicoccales bacterium]|jgi:hypothetical protein|nr:glucosaminidase domain-containing protein [Puniceicoccales bacterium]